MADQIHLSTNKLAFKLPRPLKVPAQRRLVAQNHICIHAIEFPIRYFSPVHLGGFGDSSRNMVNGANLAAVSVGAGNVYWHDTTNNLVWVKVVPFTGNFWTAEVAGSENDLYRSISLRIE